MKSCMLQNDIIEVREPQIGCGFNKLQRKLVLIKLVDLFVSTNFSVENLLLKDSNSSSSEIILIAKEYSSDEEMQRHVREMSKGRNIALKCMLKCPPTNDLDDRDTTH